MTKRILCMLLALCLVFGLAACTPAQNDPTNESTSGNQGNEGNQGDQGNEGNEDNVDKAAISGTVTLTHHRTDLEPEMEALLEAFNKEYPNVKVEVEALANYADNIRIRLAANELPDVFVLNTSILEREKWDDYFQPINGSKHYGKVYFEDIAYTGEDLLAIPMMLSYYCITYNKDLYAQAGITEVPTTWAEFEAVLEKLSALEGVTPLTTQYKTNWAIARVATYMTACIKGANWTNSWAETENPFSDAELIKSLDNLKSAVDKGYCDPDLMSSDWDLQAADFAAGTIATYIGGSYIYPTMLALGMDPESIGCYPYPISERTADGKTAAYATADTVFGVSKSAENYEACLALVDFLSEWYGYYTNQAPAVEGAPSTLVYVNELLSYNPTIVDAVRATATYNTVYKAAAIHPAYIVQEYIISDNPSSVITKYNEIWNQALKDTE